MSYYIEMELIPNTIADFDNKFKELRYPKRLNLVSKLGLNLAKAVDQLHQVGLLHLDLKPDNIGVKDTLKLLDFGYSCLWNPKVADVLHLCPQDFGVLRNIGTDGFNPTSLFGDRYSVQNYDFYAWVMTMYLLLKGEFIDSLEDHAKAFKIIQEEAKNARPGPQSSFLNALLYGLVPGNAMSFDELVQSLKYGREYDEYDLVYPKPEDI